MQATQGRDPMQNFRSRGLLILLCSMALMSIAGTFILLQYHERIWMDVHRLPLHEKNELTMRHQHASQLERPKDIKQKNAAAVDDDGSFDDWTDVDEEDPDSQPIDEQMVAIAKEKMKQASIRRFQDWFNQQASNEKNEDDSDSIGRSPAGTAERRIDRDHLQSKKDNELPSESQVESNLQEHSGPELNLSEEQDELKSSSASSSDIGPSAHDSESSNNPVPEHDESSSEPPDVDDSGASFESGDARSNAKNVTFAAEGLHRSREESSRKQSVASLPDTPGLTEEGGQVKVEAPVKVEDPVKKDAIAKILASMDAAEKETRNRTLAKPREESRATRSEAPVQHAETKGLLQSIMNVLTGNSDAVENLPQESDENSGFVSAFVPTSASPFVETSEEIAKNPVSSASALDDLQSTSSSAAYSQLSNAASKEDPSATAEATAQVLKTKSVPDAVMEDPVKADTIARLKEAIEKASEEKAAQKKAWWKE